MNLPTMYHWSPADRRDSIRATGLQPGSKSTVANGELNYVCVAPDPATAWSLSGDMDWTDDVPRWDLWLVRLGEHDETRVRAEFGARILEVKVHNVIPPDRLWLVGSRPG